MLFVELDCVHYACGSLATKDTERTGRGTDVLRNSTPFSCLWNLLLLGGDKNTEIF